MGISWSLVLASTAMPAGLCWCDAARTNEAIALGLGLDRRVNGDAKRKAIGPIAGGVVTLTAGTQCRSAGADDLWRAPVVGRQRHHCHSGIDPLDLGHRRVVSTVPAVDGLSRIADQTDVGPAVAPCLEQGVLEWVEVLCLIDEEVTESPVHQGTKRCVGLDGAQAQIEQIVEVDHPAPSLQPLVGRGEVRKARRWYGASTACGP